MSIEKLNGLFRPLPVQLTIAVDKLNVRHIGGNVAQMLKASIAGARGGEWYTDVKLDHVGAVLTRGGDRVRLTRTPRFALRRGDLVRIITGGGGGWGDPLARNPADIACDIVEGLLTPQQAASIYGIVVDAAGNVDPKATVGFRENAR